jgi:hypothetical protein
MKVNVKTETSKKIDISIDIRQQNNYFIDGDTQVVAQVSARASHHLFLFSLSKILIFNALDGPNPALALKH